MRVIAWGFIIAIVGFYIATFFATLFACDPWKKNIYPIIPGKCINKYAIAVASAALNILVDVAACIMPLKEVVKLKISRSDKIQVIAVFAAGILYVSH